MITVYCEHITPRHRFIFGYIFGDVIGVECHLTDNEDEFAASPGVKINYSNNGSAGGLQIRPHSLLFQTGIGQQDIKMDNWKGLPVFFKVANPSSIPFDPFAMAFYLVTRYEEYLPFEPDEHDRFRPELSLAYRENFIRIPVVNLVVQEMKKMLLAEFPGLSLPCRPFRFLPTVDVDIAFAHKGKGWLRASAAWVKLLLRTDFHQVRERISVLAGPMTDPYNNFDFHLTMAEKYGLHLHYFILIGKFGKYDRNTSYKSSSFKKLIKKLSLTADMGLHPSYRSYLSEKITEEEKGRLGEILMKPVTSSRFHFLRLKFPESYRLLVHCGITDDYSLGYSTLNGFRAGTCTPFKFYDLIKEEITDLRIHPFIFMDSAMIDHIKMTPGQGLEEITDLIGPVEALGGEAVGIWHNYSLCEQGSYIGWQDVMSRVFEKYQSS